ncbi:guanylate kinase [Brevibacillus laterosporus]|uniref:guanylate kinase n=1 Tax=Brevibacillus laterosporus TaxID=1465 RepID=UPI00215CFFBA|nr:guanylate kinase [Brevibacillus laterosporus]MCR8994571.1 guanylate kinase [Brevibacillus laterosporus]
MIYCLIGQSASGKSTIERNLEEMGFPRIISYTTRPPRKGETNGVDYHFIDYQTFHNLKGEGFFAETAQYRDWWYGLSLDGLDYKDNIYIVVVTVHGYKELLRIIGKENVKGIHIKVDARERMKRQLKRGDEVDEIVRRFYTDRSDFADVEEISDYIVVNEEIDSTIKDVVRIISSKAK